MYQIIVNPASRSGKGIRIWKDTIEPALISRNIPYQVHFSKKPGDVAVLSKELTQTATPKTPVKLIMLGGDGTMNEALQGITNFDAVHMGYIPTGSSNDLARDLGISKEPLEALDRILHSDTLCAMDLGILTTEAGSTAFAVACGIGFDAAVCEEAMSSKIKDTLNHLGLGKLTYLGIALKQLIKAKKVSCDLYLDEQPAIHINKVLFIASMTHKYEGGGFKFCPNADYCDGFFDICAVGDMAKPFILLVLPTAFTGDHYKFKGITSYRARRIRIQTSYPLWVQTDGEVHEYIDHIELAYSDQKLLFMI